MDMMGGLSIDYYQWSWFVEKSLLVGKLTGDAKPCPHFIPPFMSVNLIRLVFFYIPW